jgi:hypothetical protein
MKKDETRAKSKSPQTTIKAKRSIGKLQRAQYDGAVQQTAHLECGCGTLKG